MSGGQERTAHGRVKNERRHQVATWAKFEELAWPSFRPNAARNWRAPLELPKFYQLYCSSVVLGISEFPEQKIVMLMNQSRVEHSLQFSGINWFLWNSQDIALMLEAQGLFLGC